MKTTGVRIGKLIWITALLLFAAMPALAGTYPDVYLQPGRSERLGWMQTPDGNWKYADGFNLRGWHVIGDLWYYFDSDANMKTGWTEVDGVKYYLAEETAAGHPKGSMYADCQTPDGVWVDENGVPKTRSNPYGHTCVEVDITNQTVYLYEGERLVLETPCVTGYKGVHDTTVGDWAVRYKERDTYLDGPTWHSYVNYWMPFHGGMGLHDATWRGWGPENFGGQIYVTDGSHGCVNLPHAAAETIFGYAYTGMPVHVHN